MPTCESCGTTFDVDEARGTFDADPEWEGELTYEEEFSDHSVCARCAAAETLGNLGAGRAMQFNLETGLPPDGVPDDWDPSD